MDATPLGSGGDFSLILTRGLKTPGYDLASLRDAQKGYAPHQVFPSKNLCESASSAVKNFFISGAGGRGHSPGIS